MSKSRRTILKRLIAVGPSGRVFTGKTDRLTDDGHGHLQITARSTIRWCSNCHGAINDPGESYGFCGHCGRRACCIRCKAVCQVCSKLLCRSCRRGWVGSNLVTMTVCPTCYMRFRQRQAFVDQIQVRKLIFQHQILRQRERARIQALQLQVARTRMMGQLQAARLRNSARLAMIREVNRTKMALARAGYRRVLYLR